MAFLLKEFAPELFSKGLEIKATQTFKRRLAELKFRIEQQKLHREDIEDLVELTVGRMDIYHLVGALLLAFCVDFFCENGMLAEAHSEDAMPRWLVTLFLVSNFAAIGYLLFSVWLAMHASVSAHSVGVRLLTSFARLSIPTGKDLKDIQQPVAPILERLGMVGGGGVDPDTEKKEEEVKKPKEARANDMKVLEHTIPDRTLERRSTVVVNNERLTRASTARKSIMRSSTFRKSVMQGRGSTWGTMPTMGLEDLRARGSAHDLRTRGSTRIRMSSDLSVFEESMAGSMAGSEIWVGGTDSLLSTPKGEDEPAASSSEAPARSKSEETMAQSVLDGDQLNDEQSLESDHFKRYKSEQKTWLMYDAYCRVCMGLGVNQLLQALSYYIIAQVGKKSSVLALTSLLGVQLISNLMGRLDMTHAQDGRGSFSSQALYFILSSAPAAIAACLVWLPPILGANQAEIHNHSWAAPIFLVHAAFLYNVVQEVMPVSSSKLPSRIRTVNYINVLDHEPSSHTMGAGGRRGGAVLEVSKAGPWGAVAAASRQNSARATEFGKSAGVDIVTDHTGKNRSPDDLPREIVRTFTIGLAICWLMGAFFHVLVLANLDLDEMAYPKLKHDDAPHGAHGRLQMRSLGELRWPDAARLFETTALHCHGSGILVGDRFGLYGAEATGTSTSEPGVGTFGAFSLVARGSAAAMVCGAECQVLLRSDGEADGTSLLASLELPGSGASARPLSVSIPGKWRLVSAARTSERRCERGSLDMCRAVLLAGWDGHDITIADALESRQGGWRVSARFAVHPRLLNGRDAAVPAGEAYGDVVALQLGPGGATLAVLRACGVLDGWDMTSGERLGQWHVGVHSEEPAAMCHDGTDLWLARRRGRGTGSPALETVPLPAALVSRSALIPEVF